MAFKVIFCIISVGVVSSILWCHRRCICLDQSLKLVCRDITENDFFKYTGLTKEIEFKYSIISMRWLTENFKNLELVNLIDCEILDCDSVYEVKIVGACSEEAVESSVSEGSTVSSNFPLEVYAKGITPRAANKWIEKRKFDIILSAVAVCCLVCSSVGLVIGRRIILNRIREQRMAQMAQELGFEPSQQRIREPEPVMEEIGLEVDPEVTEVKSVDGRFFILSV